MSKVNVPFALLSLVTSMILWAGVYNSQNRKPDSVAQNVTVTLRDLDSKRFVVTQVPPDVSLTFTGFPDELRKLNPQSLSAIVDMSNPKLGDKEYPVIILPASARDNLVNNAISVRIKVDALVTKKVDVRILRTGNLPPGLKEESADTFPRWIYVTGPGEYVQKISAAQVNLNLSAMTPNTLELQLEPKAVDVNGRTIAKILFSETDDNIQYRPDDIQNTVKIGTTLKFVTDAPAPTLPKK